MTVGTGNISDKHLAMLRASAISEENILARGYQTVTDAQELDRLGFARAQQCVPGLLLPLHGTDGSNGMYAYRPDNPRVIEDRTKKSADGTYPIKVLKYEIPKGSEMRLDCPPNCQPGLKNPKIRLFFTEGQKKADALASAGECVVDLLGVWNFKGKNKFGGTTVLADFDYIALKDRDVLIVYDSDISKNQNVRSAMERLKEHLQRKGAHVSIVYLPPKADGSKQGVDDFLAAGHTITDLEPLIDGPREAPKAAAPVFELLDEEPFTMRRPLVLHDGQGYVATWPNVKMTVTEQADKKGEIIKLRSPIIKTEKRLLILRRDGKTFGDGGDEPLEAAGFNTHLEEIPPDNRLLSVKAVKAFRQGKRPIPAKIFQKLVDTINRFIDFDHSLADQNTMAELIACYIVATYMLDAFTVIGYIYPNGDKGTGKTQLLQLICEVAYLGLLILAGGTLPTLRDMADYGATLGFDDAENLSDPKRTDPDKRNLLLSGNRKGNTLQVKELVGDRWRTRHVNTFCPRLFSATRLPDPILASRTIVVPLIRTGDRAKANSDPMENGLWPHDRREMVDDLWLLGLLHIHELPSYERKVNETARLTGRTLEPWRAALAVARWLDDNGVLGLGTRIEELSIAYQNERPQLEDNDLTTVAIQGLCHCAVSAISAVSRETWVFEVKQIAEATSQFDEKAVESPTDPTDKDGEKERKKYLSSMSKRLGHTLAKLRLKQLPRPGGMGSRRWEVSLTDLERMTRSYSLPLPNELTQLRPTPAPSPANGTNGTNGTLAQKPTKAEWLAHNEAWLRQHPNDPDFAVRKAEFDKRSAQFRAQGISG